MTTKTEPKKGSRAVAGADLANRLGSDHQQLDSLVLDVQAGLQGGDLAAAQRDFAVLDRRLRTHMHVEDELLFPAFEERTGMQSEGPTVTLRREHAEILRRMVKMEELLRSDPREALREIVALRALHQDHSTREERVIYPTCDRLLGAVARKDVLKGLNPAEEEA